MIKKICMVMLVCSVAFFSTLVNHPEEAHAMPVLKEAVKWTIKEAIKKETKSATKSMLVKSGVRTAEKTALEKANERWFSRLAAEEVTSLQTAVERAVPASTPGWLKTVVGAGMFVTGADLAYIIYDYLNAGNDVSYYTDNPSLFGSTILGFRYREFYGVRLTYDNYTNGLGQSVLRPMLAWPDGSNKSFFLYEGGFQTAQEFAEAFFMVTEVNEQSFRATVHTKSGFQLGSYAIGNRFDDSFLIADNQNNYSWEPTAASMPETFTMPSDMQDVWPGETQAVEIIFPDPDFFPDTTGAIIANPEIVTNPVPETQPQPSAVPTTDPGTNPNPQPTTDPGTNPNPSAQPTTVPGTDPGTDPGTGPGTDPGTDPGTGPGTDPGTDPTGDDKIDFSPLRNVGITTAFPFSLPWDVKRLIDMLVAEPIAPVIPYDMFGAQGTIEMPQIVTANIPLIRSGIILLFVLGLVMITRKLLGGAQ